MPLTKWWCKDIVKLYNYLAQCLMLRRNSVKECSQWVCHCISHDLKARVLGTICYYTFCIPSPLPYINILKCVLLLCLHVFFLWGALRSSDMCVPLWILRCSIVGGLHICKLIVIMISISIFFCIPKCLHVNMVKTRRKYCLSSALVSL